MNSRFISVLILTFLAVVAGCGNEAGKTAVSGDTDSGTADKNDDSLHLQISGTYLTETERLETKVDRDFVLRCPRWGYGSPNPPISARDAINVAENALLDLKLPGNKRTWTLDVAQLKEFAIPQTAAGGHWSWTIVFQDMDVGDMQPIPTLEIRVLMDGTVIVPKVIPYVVAES